VARTRHYGWVIFGLSFLNLLVEGGIKNTVPVVYVALRDSFHWSAATTSGVFSLAGLVGGLGAPLLGRLLDRLGPGYLFPFGGVLLFAGYFTSSFVTDLWQLFILYSVIATLGENTISSFTTAATLSPWFPRSRGRILGLVDAGNSLGQVIFLPLTQGLIATIGWRHTFRILGLAFFLLVAPANFLLQKRPPRQQGAPSTPKGPAPQAAATALSPGTALTTRHGETSMARPSPLREVLRYPPVWCLGLARFLATLGSQLTQVHMVAFFLAAGYDPLLAATAVGAVGLVGLVGRPLSGALSDALGREAVYTVGMGMHMSSILLLLGLGNGQSLGPLILFVALSGLSDGISGLVVGAKAADLFPASSLGAVMGLMHMGRGLGIMLGPFLGGLLFDLRGNYGVAFFLAIILTGLAIGCMWGARWTSGAGRCGVVRHR
jgi:MFS family permease